MQRLGRPKALMETARTAIGANEHAYLAFDNVALNSAMGFAFNIEFADVSGNAWLSRGFYSEAAQEFRDVDIQAGRLSEADRYRTSARVRHA